MHITPLALMLGFLPTMASAGPFSGTWRIEEQSSVRARPPFERLLANGRYQCRDCLPPIDAPANGRFHAADGSHADQVRVAVIDDRTVETEFLTNGRRSYWNRLQVSADGRRLINVRVQHFSVPPVEVRLEYERATAAPKGAHLISGGWTLLSSKTSENGLRTRIDQTGTSFAVRGTFGEHNAVRANESFDARIGGPRVPVNGNPDRRSIQIVRISDRELLLKRSKDAALISEQRLTLSDDGRTLLSIHRRLSDGSVLQQTLRKVNQAGAP